MEKEYKAYFAMQDIKSEYKERKYIARIKGDKETADELGDRISVVDQCMNILVDAFKLTFNK